MEASAAKHTNLCRLLSAEKFFRLFLRNRKLAFKSFGGSLWKSVVSRESFHADLFLTEGIFYHMNMLEGILHNNELDQRVASI